MTTLLVYKQFRRKSRGKKLKRKWSLVAKVPLRKEFRNVITFIKWIYHMLKGGNYRVQTRFPEKLGFTSLLKFKVSRFVDAEGKGKLRIRTLDDNWDLLKNFK